MKLDRDDSIRGEDNMASNVTNEKIFQRFRQILATKLKLKENQINKDSRLIDDIGVDSVDFWEIIAKVEQDFGIDVKDDDLKGVNTVQDVVDVLRGKLGNLSRQK